MELLKSSSRKENGGEFLMSDNSNSIVSSTVSTATFANYVSSDYIRPRKRPKRLSVSCVERGKVITLISGKVTSVLVNYYQCLLT